MKNVVMSPFSRVFGQFFAVSTGAALGLGWGMERAARASSGLSSIPHAGEALGAGDGDN